MKKITIKLLALVITALMLATSVFTVACNDNDFEIKLKAPERSYYVGDSINCYSFVEKESGVAYEFAVQKIAEEGEEETEKISIIGQSYLVNETGDYTLYCTATKDEGTAEGSVNFNVKEVEPFLLKYDKDVAILPLGKKLNEQVLIDYFNAIMLSESEAKAYLTSLTVTKEGSQTSETYNLKDGSTCEYYNGKTHFLKWAGTYVYTLVYENAGGKIEQKIKCEVKEDFDSMITIKGDYSVNYDAETEVVTWDALPNASYYRVRIGDDIETVRDSLSLNISKYYQTEIKTRKLEIAAIGADESRLGKITYDGYPVPKAFQGLVMSSTGVVDAQTRTVTLKNPITPWNRYLEEENAKENEYLGIRGEFGVGTYIDFEFVGNDMPTVRLFANDIDGYVTHYVDKTTDGIILLPGKDGGLGEAGDDVWGPLIDFFSIHGDGVYTGIGGFFTHQTNLVSQAPTHNVKFVEQRLTTNSSGATGLVDQLAQFNYNDYPYLTMRGRLANPDMKFKYTVGTHAEGGTIRLDIVLSNWVGDSWNLLYDISVDTELTLDTYNAGNIVAMAPYVNGDSVSFSYSQPYTK